MAFAPARHGHHAQNHLRPTLLGKGSIVGTCGIQRHRIPAQNLPGKVFVAFRLLIRIAGKYRGAWRESAKNLIIIGEPDTSGSRPITIITHSIQEIEKPKEFRTAPPIAACPLCGSRLLSFGLLLSRRTERLIAGRVWPPPLDLACQLPRACPPASGAAGFLPAPASVRRECSCMTSLTN